MTLSTPSKANTETFAEDTLRVMFFFLLDSNMRQFKSEVTGGLPENQFFTQREAGIREMKRWIPDDLSNKSVSYYA